jgi:hypothetical protein
MFAALDLIASVLDASGKSGAHWHHRRNRKARAGTGRGFFILRDDPSKQFQFVKLFRCILSSLVTAQKWFDPSGKSLAK